MRRLTIARRERVPKAKEQCELRCGRGHACRLAPMQGYAWAQPPAPRLSSAGAAGTQPSLSPCKCRALPAVPLLEDCGANLYPRQDTDVIPLSPFSPHCQPHPAQIQRQHFHLGVGPQEGTDITLFKETPKRSSPDLKDNSGALSALSGLGKPGKAQAWGSRKGLGTSPVLVPFWESHYGTGVGRPRPPELWVEHQKRLACGGDGGRGFTSVLQLIKGLQASLACRALG